MPFRRHYTVLYMTAAFAGGFTFLFLHHLLNLAGKPICCKTNENENNEKSATPQHDANKSKVFSYKSQSFQLLNEFCTWTPPSDCARIETTSGFVMVNVHKTPPTDFDSVSGSIFRRKVWESDVMNFIMSELDKYSNSGLVDIGSNVGPFSLQAAKLGHKAIAIDPVFENVQKLCKSVEKNKLTEQVILVFNPLSDEHVNVSLDRTPPGFGMTKVVETNSSNTDESDCGDTDVMETVMLDDLIPLVTFKTAVLKIDVESFEYHVMKGGRKFLEEINTPSVTMEWTHVKKTASGKLLVELMETFNFIAHEMKSVGSYIPLTNSDYINWPNNLVWFKSRN